MKSNPVYCWDIEQGTPEWHKARIGIPTASNFSRIVDSEGKPSKQRTKYLYELASEIIKGEKTPTFQNWQMREGIKNEPQGRALYEFINDVEVKTIGLVYKDERRDRSCSPDGLVGDDGGLELKWAEAHVQVDRLFNGWSWKSDHHRQVQGSMYITDRKWWSIMSYHDGLKPIIIRVDRDDKFCAALEREMERFLGELLALVERLRGM